MCLQNSVDIFINMTGCIDDRKPTNSSDLKLFGQNCMRVFACSDQARLFENQLFRTHLRLGANFITTFARSANVVNG